MAKIDLNRFAEHYMAQSFQKRARLGLAVQNGWKNTARTFLTGGETKTEYIKGIQLDLDTPNKVICRLVGFIPNLREHGMGPGGIGTQGPYDVRKFLLKEGTKNIRTAKAGHYYLHVPFEHKFKNLPSSIKTRMEDPKTRDLLVIPSVSAPNRKTVYGDRLPAGLVPNSRPRDVRVRDQLGRFTKFVQKAHKTDKMAGMLRFGKRYARGEDSIFKTFRTVSEAGKPWISKGVTAAKIARIVMRDLPMILKRAGVM